MAREIVELSDRETEGLQRLAAESGMSANNVMRAALRFYDLVRHHVQEGRQIGFVNPDGTLHREPVGGCMGDDDDPVHVQGVEEPKA